LSLFSLSNGSCGNPSVQSMASSSFKDQWELRMICPPMEFRMKFFVLNETIKGFHLPIKWYNNPHDQWNWRIHHFPYLGHLDEVIEFDPYPFCLFDFHILFLHPNYFK
jgi:hypothetical protein